MSTTLSSRWTPFYKFILPLLTVGGMGFGAWYAHGHPEGQNLPPGVGPKYMWIFFAAVAVFVAALMWWTVGKMKRIELDDDELVISNYRSEIRVGLDAVESISGPSVTNPRRYTITLAEPTEFGRSVTFMPPMAWSLMSLGETDEVVELRNAWEAARSRAERRVS